jgi:hypothetical protein
MLVIESPKTKTQDSLKQNKKKNESLHSSNNLDFSIIRPYFSLTAYSTNFIPNKSLFRSKISNDSMVFWPTLNYENIKSKL